MAMWTIILKNDSGSIQEIEDLGISIADESQLTISDQFTYDELAGSDDLRTLVNDGDLVLNDGSNDLAAAAGVEYLTLYNKTEAKEDFYTKTELVTPDTGSLVDFTNIANVPSFGSTAWKNPVLCKVIDIVSIAPAGVDGQYYIDSDDDHLYKYVTDTWVDQGAATAGDRIINLGSATENIFEFSTTWDDQGAPDEQDAVLVSDDGDGKQAQYVYDLSGTTWTKIADVDFGTPNTLEGAYNQGGAGAGRAIDVITGAVKLDTGAATNAPIELTEKSSLPTTGLAAGQLAVKGGILCIYDGTRSKWLSVQRLYLVFARKGKTKSQYLAFAGGHLPSNNSGYRLAYNATIVSITGQLDASGTANMRIRKNDNSANIATLAISGADGNVDNTVDVDVSQNEFLQSFCDNAASVDDPVIIVEIAYRP